MVADWYYAKDGERLGPFEAQQLKQLASQGVLQPTDAVARKGTPNWVQASTVKGLFSSATPLNSNQGESTLYKDENVRVTNERVILPDMEINVGDIISAKVERKRGLLIVWAICCTVPPIILLCCTLGFLVLRLDQLNFNEPFLLFVALVPLLLMSALWSFGAYALFRADKRDRLWQLVIELANEKLETIGSMDRSTVVPVADAVNAAIKRRISP